MSKAAQLGSRLPRETNGSQKMSRQDVGNSGIARLYVNCKMRPQSPPFDHKGATLQCPGWIENGVGWQPYLRVPCRQCAAPCCWGKCKRPAADPSESHYERKCHRCARWRHELGCAARSHG